MCKETARFYCDKCQTYVPDKGTILHEHKKTFLCAVCETALSAVDVDPTDARLYCPSCELPVTVQDAIPADGAKGASCSHCGTELVEAPDPARNPLSFPIALSVIGVVARLLLKSGALEGLATYARKTDNKIDDLAARIAVAMLTECAKL